ncbi:MAG: hypothetical protein CVV05_01645 [Gammaproteobacteria bacterium HGW-Gammaproteobacteria-1]|jgi:hypothetical protein|nr:MAG: hypothetical protein CVV05_01645 [Gammaproteobacteria bacterium HGW-Gammaproteobacteria-1]
MIIKVEDGAVEVINGYRRLEASLQVFGKVLATNAHGKQYVVTREEGRLVAREAGPIEHSGVIGRTCH